MWDWINANSGGVQAVGSVIAIFVGVGLVALQHQLDIKSASRKQLKEQLLRMETAGAIATNAMNLIQEAWKNVSKDPSFTLVYYTEVFNRQTFDQAKTALLEINVSDLPDWEMVWPILEFRDLVVRAASWVEAIANADHDDRHGDPEDGREKLDTIYRAALTHMTNIDDAVNRMKAMI